MRLEPEQIEDLRDALRDAAAAHRSIELVGTDSKRLMAGRVENAEARISTARMGRMLQYEPRDLTVSVEAGMPLAQLNGELARHGQTIPLEGAWADQATVGGMVASAMSGPRRRRYGAARDFVIGMKFVTLEGKIVESGGMVVKNVAGLDMAKLMIGSFGTLAAIASVNFRVTMRPETTHTIVFACESPAGAMEVCQRALGSALNPGAVEILNPVAAQLGMKGFQVAVEVAGSSAVAAHCARVAESFGQGRLLTPPEEARFWHSLGQLTPRHMEKFKEGVVVRLATKLAECAEALASIDGPALAHAGSGSVRGWFTRPEAAARCLTLAGKRGWKGVMEFAGDNARPGLPLWPEPGSDLALMREIKRMFDPEGLLNRGRLYGQI